MCAAQEQYLSKEDQSKERGPLQKWYSHQVQLLLLLAPPKKHRSKLKGCTIGNQGTYQACTRMIPAEIRKKEGIKE